MTSASTRMDSPSPITVPVPHGERAYEILVGRGLIESAGARIGALSARAAAIVTDEHVGPLYASALTTSLEAQGLRVSVVTLPPGEATKSYASLERVCDAVLEGRCDGLAVTGGETAKHVARRLQALEIAVLREVEPGIPLCLMRTPQGEFPLVTKAGGFGDDDVFQLCLQSLRGEI